MARTLGTTNPASSLRGDAATNHNPTHLCSLLAALVSVSQYYKIAGKVDWRDVQERWGHSLHHFYQYKSQHGGSEAPEYGRSSPRGSPFISPARS